MNLVEEVISLSASIFQGERSNTFIDQSGPYDDVYGADYAVDHGNAPPP
jgi:hypothetical protein